MNIRYKGNKTQAAERLGMSREGTAQEAEAAGDGVTATRVGGGR